MRIPAVFGAIVLATVSAGCASTNQAVDTLVFTGRIVETRAVAAVPRSDMGIYRPGMGGALGAVTALALSHLSGTASYNVHTIKDREGVVQSMPTQSEHAVGSCVGAWVERSMVRHPYWNLGEVALRPSTTCD